MFERARDMCKLLRTFDAMSRHLETIVEEAATRGVRTHWIERREHVDIATPTSLRTVADYLMRMMPAIAKVAGQTNFHVDVTNPVTNIMWKTTADPTEWDPQTFDGWAFAYKYIVSLISKLDPDVPVLTDEDFGTIFHTAAHYMDLLEWNECSFVHLIPWREYLTSKLGPLHTISDIVTLQETVWSRHKLFATPPSIAFYRMRNPTQRFHELSIASPAMMLAWYRFQQVASLFKAHSYLPAWLMRELSVNRLPFFEKGSTHADPSADVHELLIPLVSQLPGEHNRLEGVNLFGIQSYTVSRFLIGVDLLAATRSDGAPSQVKKYDLLWAVRI